MNSRSRKGRHSDPVKKTMAVAEAPTDVAIVPYDENLLERARIQWQFGDWASLVRIERNTLQHHPERAKIALLAAAGHFQTDNPNEAMHYIRLAKDWGCSNKLIVQLLAAGVHNSLGRAAARSGQQHRAFEHFRQSVLLGTPGSDTRLLAQARAEHQHKLLELCAPDQGALLAGKESAATGVMPAVHYLVTVHLRINNAATVKLGLSTSRTEGLTMQQDIVEYRTEKGAPLYLVSNEHGDFEKAPHNPQIPITTDTSYIFSGQITHSGDNRPVVWIFQYADGKKIGAQSISTEEGRFRHNLKPLPAADSFAIGIRLAGNGSFIPNETIFSLQEWGNEALSTYLEDKMEMLKQSQKHDVENSMKQIEACIRLQHYLGADIILPDLHNWPISPDFGVLLINLVEQNNYDAVVEFGSGTSTLLLATALDRVGRRGQRAPLPLLSFDHLPEYGNKTTTLLRQAGLTEHANIVLAPLTAWQDENGNTFSYYACAEALREFQQQLPAAAARLLVVVDGPPAATGCHARYPALQNIMTIFKDKYCIHFLLDDYLRVDEQEIVTRWTQRLRALGIAYHQTEFNNLEKRACLVEIGSDIAGNSE